MRLVDHDSSAALVPDLPLPDLVELLTTHGVSCVYLATAERAAKTATRICDKHGDLLSATNARLAVRRCPAARGNHSLAYMTELSGVHAALGDLARTQALVAEAVAMLSDKARPDLMRATQNALERACPT